MVKKGIPQRWKNYLAIGSPVPGTRFLPFKVPLKLELCRNQPESDQFTPSLLLESTPMLKAVIDLTNTDRYYNAEEFTSKGVLYKKVYVNGGGHIPSEHERQQFFDAVDQLRETLRHDSDALIGVHCTHGLNRTGYLICKYMVSRMKIDPQEAINKFQEARGHKMERNNYVYDIMNRKDPRRQKSPEDWRSKSPRRNTEPQLFSSLQRYRQHGSRDRNDLKNCDHYRKRSFKFRREQQSFPSSSPYRQYNSHGNNRYDFDVPDYVQRSNHYKPRQKPTFY